MKADGAVVLDGTSSPPDVLAERAAQIGTAWAAEYLRELRARARAAVGAWPGTMSEARGRVVTRLAIGLAPDRLQELARIANLAARQRWMKVSEPDLEI